MIKVITGDTINRDEEEILPANTTLRSVLDRKGYSSATGTFMLNNTFLTSADLDKTFKDFPEPPSGVYKLLDVVKARNAA